MPRDYEINQSFLKTIVGPEDANLDVVAVHGLNPKNTPNHAEATWTSGDKLWLRDFFPDLSPKTRVMLFGYNANVAFETSSAGIREQAENLLNWLNIERKNDPGRMLVFFCHSMGGILVKRALVHAKSDKNYEPIHTSTAGLVFFATPHKGGNHAALGDVAAKIARGVLLYPSNTFMEALKRNSIFADTFIDDFRQHLEDYLILSFYETRPMGKLGIIVDKRSATLGLPGTRELQIGLDADHREICKFKSEGDPIFKQVSQNILFLLEAAWTAKTHKSSLSRLGISSLKTEEKLKFHSTWRTEDIKTHLYGFLN
ncbi:hypothetical protein GGR51DRAFT_286998 [Nemania sp. FL0031]|nr:hypothetical protein GGR51DRAFT_286998 [Nemania sp. FL0031]